MSQYVYHKLSTHSFNHLFNIQMSFFSQKAQAFEFPTPYGLPSELCPDQMMSLLHKIQSPPTPTPNLDIILSKFLNNDELNDIQIQQLSEQQRYAIDQVTERANHSKKRPDEYRKLFYRRAFKFAQNEYFGKRGTNKSRKMAGFYHHHFGGIAKTMNVPLVNFYNPDRKTKPGLKVGQKSFNKAFIRLLLRSESFRAASRIYRQKFREQCAHERKNKIPIFTTYLKKVIVKYGHDYSKMSEAIRSSKCKVPWTNQEIEEADRRANEELEQSYIPCLREADGEDDYGFSDGSCELSDE